MKHKVKEIFDNREEYRRWEDDIQELFNCQLTVEEIDALILTAKVFGTASALAGRPLEECERFISVQKKLLKQKEMWVSEDE